MLGLWLGLGLVLGLGLGLGSGLSFLISILMVRIHSPQTYTVVAPLKQSNTTMVSKTCAPNKNPHPSLSEVFLNYNKLAFTIIPNYAWHETPPLIQEKVENKRRWSGNEGITNIHHSITNNQRSLCPTNDPPHHPLDSNTSCFQA